MSLIFSIIHIWLETSSLHLIGFCNFDLYFTDFLSPSMTCNIGMLSDFFSSKNDDKCDWFLEDFNNIMNHKIQKTFEEFGKNNYSIHSFY